jgi:RimJ/RimL family protein N-acetyltransferase
MSFHVHIAGLTLSQFKAADIRELYVIRNHPSVRQHMTSSKPIPYRQHVSWCAENLLNRADPSPLLLMVRRGGQKRAAGLTQLRIKNDQAEIGVIFKEPQRHRFEAGIATVATLHMAFCELGLQSLISYVIPSHTAALEFNRAFGATQIDSDKPGMIKLFLPRDVCLRNDHYRKVIERYV